MIYGNHNGSSFTLLVRSPVTAPTVRGFVVSIAELHVSALVVFTLHLGEYHFKSFLVFTFVLHCIPLLMGGANMSRSSVNNKSQQLNARFPHEVVSGIEASLQPGETKANFIVTAVRGEIARRQAEGSGENPLVSSLDALAQVEKLGIKAAEEIGQLVTVAREELQRRKTKEPE
ncbi:hypothetical protein IUC20_004768 [Escherichia coli]|nr:hypothetical protein [Escherichia coli]EEX8882747.1 hypothetical protein [Escherichia coli]EFF5350990.1 hypothetical protein [Escherichia coli]EGN7724769.1 hypothetical protein [Escherichia coli]EHK0872422.1 hypothetical protein [Escherichia coli]